MLDTPASDDGVSLPVTPVKRPAHAAISRHRISLNRLKKLLNAVGPAARVGAMLAALDPELLRRGMNRWLARRERPGSARRLAARRWRTRDIR
jgi:hypothetical protein